MAGPASVTMPAAFVLPVAMPATPAKVRAVPRKLEAVATRTMATRTTDVFTLDSSTIAIAAFGASAMLAKGRQGVASTALRAGPKVLEGTGGPMPDDFWDPAGLTKGKSDEKLLYWRAVELKHGRVCMLAVLGWFHVAAGWHPIGDAAARLRVSDNPLINVTQLPIGGAFQVIFTIMCLEWLTTYVCKPPADKPWDVLGWSPVIADEDAPNWKQSKLQELNNGRLAMMGFMGLVSQDLYTGDYFSGIGKLCFGNSICDDIDSWTSPFPPTPFVMPPLYPMAPFS